MKKTKSGISLIVLVITILVLAILAATVIIAISNTNAIAQASKTAFKSDMSSYKEAFELYVAGRLAEDPSFDRTTITTEDLETILGKIEKKYKDGLKVQDGKLVYDTEDEAEKEVAKDLGMEKPDPTAGVTIPEGFYYVGGTKDTGLVISDNALDENKGVDYTCVGNQFVWVPVDDYSKFVRGEANSTTNTMTGTLDTTKYTEPYASGYSTEEAEYKAMCNSVKIYGGFYIARFEAGDGDATEGTNGVTKGARTAPTAAHKVVSKKGACVYNYVPWGESMSSISPYTAFGIENIAGAVYLSQQMAKDNNYTSVVSTLCYGVQWDAIMNFISDTVSITNSSSWGNHSDNTETGAGSLCTTGYNEKWKVKNIYDLAGNVWEWTMEEESSGKRVRRGGKYDYSGSGLPACLRAGYNYADIGGMIGFRPALYIK